MRALIVVKKTHYELYGAVGLEDGAPPTPVAQTIQTAHVDHVTTVRELLVETARLRWQTEVIAREGAWDFDPATFDVVISVGGDGTLLSASHHVGPSTLLVGVCSSDTSVGHLCAADADAVKQLLHDIDKGNASVIRVTRMVAVVTRLGGRRKPIYTEPVLNDILYANENPAETTRYRIVVGATIEDQKSSGIWIATPAGSTAAILAAGGVKMPLASKALQFKVRELYKSRRDLAQISHAVLHEPTHFEIENHCQRAILALDGQHGLV